MSITKVSATELVTSRAFGKCGRKGCGGRQVLEVEGPDRYSAFEILRSTWRSGGRYGRCPKCGWFSKWSVGLVQVTISEATPCGQRCTDAMTPNCKCSCGGAHHGENVAEYDKWSGS
jgi:hypothetical protein